METYPACHRQEYESKLTMNADLLRQGAFSRQTFTSASLEALSENSENEQLSEDEDGDSGSVTSGGRYQMTLHSMHLPSSESDEEGSHEFAPVTLPDCHTSAQLARAVVKKEEVMGAAVTKHVRLRFTLRDGHLTCVDDLNLDVPLFHAEVAFADSKQSTLIIVVIPHDETFTEHALTEARGWIFQCSHPLKVLIERLVRSGAYINELQAHYSLDLECKPGGGAFGTVVAGFSRSRKQPVAVKLLKSKVKPDSVFQEMDMLSAAQGCPHIIQFYGVFMDLSAKHSKKSWALVFEYHRKGSLYEYVVHGRLLLEWEALPFLHNLLSALKFLGSRNIFHRDIKPENLLVSSSRELVLTDFGLAIHITNRTAMAQKVGSIGYTSPEMLLGENVGCHGDAFGAGVVMYFMLSKSTPFLAPTTQLIQERTFAGKVNFGYGCFHRVSKGCITLMLGLLKVDIESRLGPHEALAQTCFKDSMRAPSAATEPNMPELDVCNSRSHRPAEAKAKALLAEAKAKAATAPPSEGSFPVIRDATVEGLDLHAGGYPAGS
eukprot:TRINITY_DN105577_c0_g1_i1.p1 TRINITY_DN105577_c0_g1~~TRINITY_DN105577_c0_g1_i1.p1  ORF type:complete len:547 (+),score=111.98 TRINITY_DN105577_c0_g1_i1:59-1699(+)